MMRLLLITEEEVLTMMVRRTRQDDDVPYARIKTVWGRELHYSVLISIAQAYITRNRPTLHYLYCFVVSTHIPSRHCYYAMLCVH